MSKKVDIDFKKIGNKIKDFFKNFRKMPKDEQYAYIAIAVGIVFIILGFIL